MERGTRAGRRRLRDVDSNLTEGLNATPPCAQRDGRKTIQSEQ